MWELAYAGPGYAI